MLDIYYTASSKEVDGQAHLFILTPLLPVPFFFAGLPQEMRSTSETTGLQHFCRLSHDIPSVWMSTSLLLEKCNADGVVPLLR